MESSSGSKTKQVQNTTTHSFFRFLQSHNTHNHNACRASVTLRQQTMEVEHYYASDAPDTSSTTSRVLRKMSVCILVTGFILATLVGGGALGYYVYSETFIGPTFSLYDFWMLVLLVFGASSFIAIIAVSSIIFGILRCAARSFEPEVVYVSRDEFQGLNPSSGNHPYSQL